LEAATINPSTEHLVIVLQGYGGDPPDGKTQAKNAGGDLDIDSEGLGKIEEMAKGNTAIQVVTYASSASENTKKDVVASIKSLKNINPNGKVIIVGHSQGADNAIELLGENRNLGVDLLITLDIKDASKFGIFNLDDDNIHGNVKNVINYYKVGELIGGEHVDIHDPKNTNGVNILSPGSNHTSIDGDLVDFIIEDINFLIESFEFDKSSFELGENPFNIIRENVVEKAKRRNLPYI